MLPLLLIVSAIALGLSERETPPARAVRRTVARAAQKVRGMISRSRAEAIAAASGLDVGAVLAVAGTESAGHDAAVRFEPHKAIQYVPGLKGLIPHHPDADGINRHREETNRGAFERALALLKQPQNRRHVLNATAWGRYQVHPTGLLLPGDGTVDGFLSLFSTDPAAASDALLIAYLRARPDVVRAGNEAVAAGGSADAWRKFSSRYNGPRYESTGHHLSMARHYQAAATV